MFNFGDKVWFKKGHKIFTGTVVDFTKSGSLEIRVKGKYSTKHFIVDPKNPNTNVKLNK